MGPFHLFDLFIEEYIEATLSGGVKKPKVEVDIKLL